MADISLEIHHLDVRGGDAAAIIVKQHYRDETMGDEEAEEGAYEIYRVLIDAGAETGGSVALASYLEKHFPGPFDLIIATHYHQDHIQGFHAANVHYKAFLDNGAYVDAVGTFEPINDIGKGARSKVFRAYGARTQQSLMYDRGNPALTAKPQRMEIPFIKKDFAGKAAPFVIKLGDTGITLTCYCANGILANGTNVLKQQKDVRKKAINPNDVSLAFLLEWGDFRYLTAGDLSGATASTNYYNIEKELVDYLINPVDGPLKNKTVSVFKASHHGSEHSNQDYLFEKLKPETVVVSCNLHKRVPSPLFLDRLKKHFKNQIDGALVFTNTLKVFKNSDLYSRLEDLTRYVAKGNLILPDEEEDTNPAFSNLGIKTAIIRRRVTDGKFDYDDNVPAGATYTGMTGYEIILTERDAADADDADTLTFKDYDFKGNWKKVNCSKENIREGFSVQAKEMIRWLKADAPDATGEERTKGIEYIRKFYPALVEITQDFDDAAPADPQYVQMETNLNNKMGAILDDAFVEYTANQTISYKWNGANQLTNDDKTTLYNLLVENSHQMIFTQSYPYLHTFNSALCWNVKKEPEPYSQPPPPNTGQRKKFFEQYPGMTKRTDKKQKTGPK